MDKAQFDECLKMLSSSNDADAVMALRSLQGFFAAEGVLIDSALRYAAAHIAEYRVQVSSMSLTPSLKLVPAAEKPSGVPDCASPRQGVIEIHGEVYTLSGKAATDSANIALHVKDALVAAFINKSKLKLKLVDQKNNRGEVIETVLQAEYDRDGMIPITIWINARGEVGTLAAVLRKALAKEVPELIG